MMLRRNLFLFLACVLWATLASAQESQATLKKEAEQLFREGKWKESLETYNNLIRLFPPDSVVLFDRGMVHLALHDFSHAEKDFAAQAAFDSTEADAWFMLGIVCMKQNKATEALACFSKTLSRDPENADAHYFSGRLQLEMQHLKTAIYDFTHAIEHNLSHDEALAYRGWTYAQLGETDKALTDLSIALHMNPRYTDARYFYSRVLMEKQNFAASIRQLDTLAQQDPWYMPEEWWLNGYKVHQVKLQKQVVASFKKMKGSELSARKAHVAMMLGLHKLADKLYSEKNLQTAVNAPVAYLRARLLLKAGKETEALNLLHGVCNGNAPVASPYYYRALLLFKSGKLDAACADRLTFTQMADREPKGLDFLCR